MNLNNVVPNLTLLKVNKEQICFEERVKVNCFYCPKYKNNWMCPPNIPNLDYKKIIMEYNNCNIVTINMKINNNLDEVRRLTTNELHIGLLKLEKELWNNNFPLGISFLGGSCKLCKDGCGKEKCLQPEKARIPVEALGINLIKTLKTIDVDIVFPPIEKLYRFGMILW